MCQLERNVVSGVSSDGSFLVSSTGAVIQFPLTKKNETQSSLPLLLI